MRRLTVKPINKRTSVLPDETVGRDLVLMRVKEGRVVERTLFHNYPESMGAFVTGYTHYVALPRYL